MYAHIQAQGRVTQGDNGSSFHTPDLQGKWRLASFVQNGFENLFKLAVGTVFNSDQQNGKALATVVIWVVNQEMKIFSVCLSLSLCNSVIQINK